MHQEMGLTVHSIAQLPPFYQKKARKAFSPGTSSEEAGRLQSQNGRWKNGEIGMIANVCYKQTFSARDFQDDFLESPSGPDEKSFLVSFKFIARAGLKSGKKGQNT